MKDEEKAKDELINELVEMRQQITELQALERKYKKAEEVWYKRKDGSVFPTLMTGTLIRGRKEKSLFLSATVIDNKSEEIKHRLKIIARTASEGGETVRRLQYFTGRKVSRQDFTRLDLNEIVREAISSTSPRWKDEAEAKGITIRIKEKLGKLPSILGSRSGLMEVLTNLIFNALESMSKGGEITIRTEAKENEVLLYFTDSGQGIPDRIKEKIFHPFFTTKGPQASGLGLSVSYGIIKRHRGKIKVESSKGKGTTFTISMLFA